MENIIRPVDCRVEMGCLVLEQNGDNDEPNKLTIVPLDNEFLSVMFTALNEEWDERQQLLALKGGEE